MGRHIPKSQVRLRGTHLNTQHGGESIGGVRRTQEQVSNLAARKRTKTSIHSPIKSHPKIREKETNHVGCQERWKM